MRVGAYEIYKSRLYSFRSQEVCRFVSEFILVISQLTYKASVMMHTKNILSTVLLFVCFVYAATIADVIAANNALIPLADSTDIAVVVITAQTDATAAQVSPFRLLISGQSIHDLQSYD